MKTTLITRVTWLHKLHELHGVQWLALVSVLAFVGNGCAVVTGGHRITPTMVSFIRSGITTRQELLENLGPPTLDLEDGRLIAYTWETTGQQYASFFFVDRHWGEIGPRQRQWAFCVAFDKTERVAHRATICCGQEETLRAATLSWYRRSN